MLIKTLIAQNQCCGFFLLLQLNFFASTQSQKLVFISFSETYFKAFRCDDTIEIRLHNFLLILRNIKFGQNDCGSNCHLLKGESLSNTISQTSRKWSKTKCLVIGDCIPPPFRKKFIRILPVLWIMMYRINVRMNASSFRNFNSTYFHILLHKKNRKKKKLRNEINNHDRGKKKIIITSMLVLFKKGTGGMIRSVSWMTYLR